ncbi:hypothetical protein SLEP1_g39516 [Rubroshorea leprosula]|uniref:Uncharacterized protein n=1 Tax=Rubroshorea leprosula TaxID=152421 RepID=A0AAV5L0G1_9ROSI|nr:hypothetical protein SLEP1_g39516 [Rubroshorea leprosula]
MLGTHLASAKKLVHMVEILLEFFEFISLRKWSIKSTICIYICMEFVPTLVFSCIYFTSHFQVKNLLTQTRLQDDMWEKEGWLASLKLQKKLETDRERSSRSRASQNYCRILSLLLSIFPLL